MVRIGLWGPLYYNYNQEAQKPYSNYLGPYVTTRLHSRVQGVRVPYNYHQGLGLRPGFKGSIKVP